jgi:antibiotic biosynthesis monooxygenase (ABM) superfamily enzyme
MVKVLIKRRVKAENYRRLLELMLELRVMAMRQPGYVTGETLVRGKDPIEVLAIGTWLSEGHWKAWSIDQRRIEITDMLDLLIENGVETTVYSIPDED